MLDTLHSCQGEDAYDTTWPSSCQDGSASFCVKTPCYRVKILFCLEYPKSVQMKSNQTIKKRIRWITKNTDIKRIAESNTTKISFFLLFLIHLPQRFFSLTSPNTYTSHWIPYPGNMLLIYHKGIMHSHPDHCSTVGALLIHPPCTGK